MFTYKEQYETRIEELEERKDELENCDNEQEFDDFLDESYGDFINLYASDILKSCDPIRYNCEHSDFNDSLLYDVDNELEQLREELKELEEDLEDEWTREFIYRRVH